MCSFKIKQVADIAESSFHSVLILHGTIDKHTD